VPEGWLLSSYGGAANVNAESLSPSKVDADRVIEYLDIASVPSTGVVGETQALRFADAPSRARRVVRSGDTIVSTVRPYLRSFAFIDEALPNLVASTGFAVLSPNPGVEPRFLYQTVLTAQFVDFLSGRMKGSNYPAVNASDVADAPLLLPPLAEQKKIAEILGSLDEAIQATQAVIDQTRKVKQALLQQLLTRGIGHTRFKQTEIGEIPESWEVVPCGEVFDVQLGKMLSETARSGDNPLPYLRNQNVYWDRFDLSDIGEMSFSDREMQKYRLQHGDILACEGRFIGRCAIWRGEVDEMYYQKALHRLRPRSTRVSPEYMLFFMMYRFRYDRRFVATMHHESTIPHLPLEKLIKLPVLVPPEEEQERIVDRLRSTTDAEDNSEMACRHLRRVKDALLSDLLSGRVRVQVDP
jgi:type I restriction enzyme S subunit